MHECDAESALTNTHSRCQFARRNGTLTSFLYSDFSKNLGTPGISFADPLLKVATDMLTGLAYLHSGCINERGAGYIHRDVKPDNVLLTRTFGAKLADLGEARQYDAEEVTMTQVGTPT